GRGEDAKQLASADIVQPSVDDYLRLSAQPLVHVLPGLPGSPRFRAEHKIGSNLAFRKPLTGRLGVPPAPRPKRTLDVRTARKLTSLSVPHNDEPPFRCHGTIVTHAATLRQGRRARGLQVRWVAGFIAPTGWVPRWIATFTPVFPDETPDP